MSEKKNYLTVSELSRRGFVSQPGLKKSNLAVRLSSFLTLSVALSFLPITFGVVGLSAAAVAAEPAAETWKDLDGSLPEVAISSRIQMRDANGDLLAEVWDENRIQLDSLDKVGKWSVKALVNTEDKRFYENGAFDPLAIGRALATGRGGGSGLTQQLVKNLQYFNALSTDLDKREAVAPTLSRKLQELKYAITWDQTHSKDETLLAYFNTVAFGKGSIYGIEAAAQYFFGKPATDLTLAETAALIGSVNNPVEFSLEGSEWKTRQVVVLESMLREGSISQEEFDAAQAEELTIGAHTRGGNCSTAADPYYCDYVMSVLRSSPRFGGTQEERDAFITRGGFTVQTNYNPGMSSLLYEDLKQKLGANNRVVAPTVVVKPGTGAVEAIGVNREYGEGEGHTTINVALNPVGLGSAFKPITLAAALESGLNEADLNFAGGCSFDPAGFDYPPGGFTNSVSCALQGGQLDAKHAIAYSSNTWFTKLETMIGIPAVKSMAESMGLRNNGQFGETSLSYTLGAGEESPVDVAAAFATFANGGIYCPPTPIASITYTDGSTVPPANGYDPALDSCRRVMSPKTASTVLRTLVANVSGEIPNAFGREHGIPGWQTGGKSGTNQLYNSSWAQVSATHSLYTNFYDFDQLTNEVENVWYDGRWVNWTENVAAISGSHLLGAILANESPVPLDLNNEDANGSKAKITEDGFIFVPSVIGLTPSEAVAILEDAGLTPKLSKETVSRMNGMPSGVIGEQSVDPGTRLSSGVDVILKETA